jgi:hypothetical protein
MKTLLLTSALALSGAVAYAQQPCAPLAELTPHFLEKYGEVPAFDGDMQQAGKVVGFVLFKNPETKTWTAFSVDGGIACFLAAGGNWKDFNPRGDL